MAVDSATNPFDADGWVSEIELSRDEYVPLGPGPLQIAIPDSRRLWLLVATSVPGLVTWSLWPDSRQSNYGILPQTGQDHLLVHNASYPSLVQGEWWIYSSGGGVTFYVITGRDMH